MLDKMLYNNYMELLVVKIITTHKGADFDALASVVTAGLIYPDAVLVLPKNINPNVKAFLAIHKDLFNLKNPSDINHEEVKTLVLVDACNWNRIEGMKGLKNNNDLEIIIWDHHIGSDMNPTWECQEKTGATVTLLARELIKKRTIVTPMIATLMLMGLYEDTGNLSFSTTTSEDAFVCSYLLERKADLSVLNSFLRPAYGEKQKKILFEMLKTSKRKTINGYKLALCSVDIDGHIGNLSVVVNMYRDLENVDAAFGLFFEKKKEKCIVIGRGRDEGLDIGKLMRNIGGGGHPGAGSAMVKLGFLNNESIVDIISELISGDQQSSVQLADIMSYPVFSVADDTTMEQVALILREKGCSGVPVVKQKKLVGIISRRDFKKMRKEIHMQSPVKAYMSKSVFSIDVTKSPLEAVRLMMKHDVGRIPVIKNDDIIGIVTRTDAMRFYYNLLPD